MNWNQLKKNWPTTVSALVTALFGYVATTHPAWSPAWLTELSAYAQWGGLVALGITAKAAGVTGVGDNAK